jgi:hypothetical protein
LARFRMARWGKAGKTRRGEVASVEVRQARQVLAWLGWIRTGKAGRVRHGRA